jgi:hypothetical protein
MVARRGRELDRGTCMPTAFDADENTCIVFPLAGEVA